MANSVMGRKRELLKAQIADALEKRFDSLGLPKTREIEVVEEAGWEHPGSENRVPGQFAECDDFGIVAKNADWKMLQKLHGAIEGAYPDLRQELDWVVIIQKSGWHFRFKLTRAQMVAILFAGRDWLEPPSKGYIHALKCIRLDRKWSVELGSFEHAGAQWFELKVLPYWPVKETIEASWERSKRF